MFIRENEFENIYFGHSKSLKTKDRQFDKIGVTDGTIFCHCDNLLCQQSRRGCQFGDILL